MINELMLAHQLEKAGAVEQIRNDIDETANIHKMQAIGLTVLTGMSILAHEAIRLLPSGMEEEVAAGNKALMISAGACALAKTAQALCSGTSRSALNGM
jgi:hypothetical protein